MKYTLTDIQSNVVRESIISIQIGSDEIEFIITTDEHDTTIRIVKTDVDILNKHSISYNFSPSSNTYYLNTGDLHDELEDEVTEGINEGTIY